MKERQKRRRANQNSSGRHSTDDGPEIQVERPLPRGSRANRNSAPATAESKYKYRNGETIVDEDSTGTPGKGGQPEESPCESFVSGAPPERTSTMMPRLPSVPESGISTGTVPPPERTNLGEDDTPGPNDEGTTNFLKMVSPIQSVVSVNDDQPQHDLIDAEAGSIVTGGEGDEDHRIAS